MTTDRVVVIGAGQAGAGVAAALREQGFTGPVTVVGRESHAPYERPPLSKAYLAAAPLDEQHLALRTGSWYADHDVALRLGAHAEEIDRGARTVRLAGGERLDYDHLVLATGTRPRTLPIVGADLDDVLVLRGLDDARALRDRLDTARTVLTVGAGFIGLEVAAAAHKRGVHPVVVDVAGRVMERAVTPTTSSFVADAHRAWGTELLLGTGITEVLGHRGRVSGAVTTTGVEFGADLVVMAVGVAPEVRLAEAAGLDIGDGVMVDEYLRTSDPAISAVGDCAWFPEPVSGRRARLESVQAAADHSRCVAARIAGNPEPYTAVPWFWTHQGDLKLQIAGLGTGVDTEVLRGDPSTRRFAVLGYREGTLATVESINRPADHVAARRLLAAGASPSPDQAGDPAFDLKSFAAAASAPVS
ncbi:FAD-dependent oxidoreductase [Pseudonocardia sp. NPDC049154]|uniref:NAD(P)/FAD-dependent oxidoreductase n=1 Tax=Pseudonocardia sp. NPDC049154 TaxID=3155501 RepID=UPI0033D31989